MNAQKAKISKMRPVQVGGMLLFSFIVVFSSCPLKKWIFSHTPVSEMAIQKKTGSVSVSGQSKTVVCSPIAFISHTDFQYVSLPVLLFVFSVTLTRHHVQIILPDILQDISQLPLYLRHSLLRI